MPMPNLPPPQAKYLGDSTRREYPIFGRWLVGNVWYCAHFATHDERDVYQAGNSRIKDEIAAINYSHRDGCITKEEHAGKMKEEWCPLVYSFIDTYGKLMVSEDIRWALNDVEKNVGLPTTSWDGHELVTEDAMGIGNIIELIRLGQGG